MKIKILVATLVLALPMGVWAQKRKTTTSKARPVATTAPVQQKSAADILYDNMLPNTQKVFIIDSAVVARDQFMTAIPLSRDNGTIEAYDDFFGTDGHPDDYVYVNGFRNKCYYSETDTTGTVILYTRDRINGKWSNALPLEGIGTFSTQMAFPYMMADGTTLYFAAKGKESLGGYDIFVTRYDPEDGRYLKPENIGLPFNSRADDYMYIEDDLNQLAWFVSSRNQPEGLVCVYTLVPTTDRENYDLGETSEERIKQLAAIARIRDTWPSAAKRNQAMKRLQDLRQGTVASTTSDIRFVVNDQTVYTNADDFRTTDGADRFARIQAMKDELRKEEHHLDLIRKEYRNTTGATHDRLASDIQDYERIMQRQHREIRAMEKQLRNDENQID